MAYAKILLAQSESVVAAEIENKLKSLGYTVVATASCREEAIKKVEEARPDLVLMDIWLKEELDGVVTADEIRMRFNIPVVYLTAYADEKILQRAKITEPYGYILKPVEERELHTTIEIALYKHMMEKKLKESEQWLATTLRSIVDAVIASNTTGEIKFMNSIAEVLTGYKERDALGRDLKDVFNVIDEKTRYPIESHIIKTLNEGAIVVLSNQMIISANGREIPIDINAAPIRDDKGNIAGMVITFHDITERRKVDMLKEEFISNVSHELRTPLTTIREGISQVLDGILGETTPEQREFLSICLGDVDRLKRIINNLLDISKMEAGKVELEREITDIVALIKRVVSLFLPQAKEKGLEIRTAFPSTEAIEVYADKDKIVQVFNNLINNALKFTKEGYIEIIVVDKGESIECSVSDTGAGIPEEDLPKVFDKFQQFGRVAGAGEKGTGLGLSIVKGIINLHGGEIWVGSKLNQGTKFAFTLSKCKTDKIFSRYLGNAIKMAQESESVLSIILVKVVNFEKIRESYKDGRLQEIFEAIESLIKRSVRGIDIVIPRFERKEIVAILPDTMIKGAEIVKGRIKEALGSYTFCDEKSFLPIEFNYGVVSYPVDGINESQLMERAESYALLTEEEKISAKKILIVDDEPNIVNTIKRILGSQGYGEILGAFNGKEALEIIAEKNPNLVILDMKLPDISGYEIIGRLKEEGKTSDIPIIILSGYPVNEDSLSGAKTKAIPVIPKPFENVQVIDMVRKILKG